MNLFNLLQNAECFVLVWVIELIWVEEVICYFNFKVDITSVKFYSFLEVKISVLFGFS